MKAILFSIVLLLPLLISAHAPHTTNEATGLSTAKPAFFIANVGQIKDQWQHRRSDIDFMLSLPGATVFVGKGQLHYQFESGRNHMGAKQTYRLDYQLEKSSQRAVARPSEAQAYFEQYYTETSGQGVTARSYQKITYPEVYPGIDWVLYTHMGELKYDFVVRPGADPAKIRMKFTGASSMRILTDGSLEAKTPAGTVKEKPPVAYYQANGKPLPVKFTLSGFTAGVDMVIQKQTVVIDPAIRLWGTYYGGTGTDRINKVATDAVGNVYAVGNTASGGNIATIGAHQVTRSSIGSTTDGFLVKFNSNGVRQWATYYGGSAADDARGVACDPFGKVYICGSTSSSSGIATAGSFKPAYGDFGDAFLAKFDSTGVREWATYYGDSLEAFANAVTCDDAGNVYMGGITTDTTGIATPGRFQSTYLSLDAFIVKFNPSGQRIWGSYYGGYGRDEITNLAYNPATRSVLVVGATYSTSNIASTGAFQTAIINPGANNNDGFIMRLDTAGQRMWGSYYGGSSYDAMNDIAGDQYGNIYAVGYASGGGHLVSPDAYITNSYSGGAIIAKFDSSGSRKWATYLTSTSSSSTAASVALDLRGNMLIGGSTGLSYSIGSPGSFQPTVNSGYSNTSRDGFLVRLSPDGHQVWSTFYGTPTDDYIQGLAYNPATRNIYFGGYTGNSSANSIFGSPGSLQPTLGGGSSDGYLAAFRNDTSVYLRFPFSDTLWCPGSSINIGFGADTFRTGNSFMVQLSNEWGQFTTGANIIGSTVATTGGNISCNIPAGLPVGNNYRIRIISTLPADTSLYPKVNIRMGTPITGITSATTNTPVCANDTLKLNALFSGTGTITHYRWTGPDGFYATVQNPIIRYVTTAASGTYRVTAMNGGCAASTDTVTVVVKPLPDTAVMSAASPICNGDTMHLYATCTTPGVTFVWSGGINGFSASGAYVAIPSVTPAHSAFYKATSVLNGCASLPTYGKSVLVLNNNNPYATFVASPGLSVPSGATITFTATAYSVGSSPSYQWRKNGVAIAGATALVYSSSALVNNDAISLMVRSSEQCARPDTFVTPSQTVTVTPNAVGTVTGESKILLYPNPTRGQFHLGGLLPSGTPVTIEIISGSGHVIFRDKMNISTPKSDPLIDLQSPAPGLYMLRVIQNGETTTMRFIVL